MFTAEFCTNLQAKAKSESIAEKYQNLQAQYPTTINVMTDSKIISSQMLLPKTDGQAFMQRQN
jgi:hypothetical protein